VGLSPTSPPKSAPTGLCLRFLLCFGGLYRERLNMMQSRSLLTSLGLWDTYIAIVMCRLCGRIIQATQSPLPSQHCTYVKGCFSYAGTICTAARLCLGFRSQWRRQHAGVSQQWLGRIWQSRGWPCHGHGHTSPVLQCFGSCGWRKCMYACMPGMCVHLYILRILCILQPLLLQGAFPFRYEA
jgi:hypothetical protein